MNKYLFKTICFVFTLFCLPDSNSMYAQSSLSDIYRSNLYQSTNNDKYWYSRYAIERELDSDEWVYVKPQNGEYEVEFRYAKDQKSTFPVAVFLNEIHDGSIVSSDLIASIRAASTSIKLNDASVSLYCATNQITITENGSIVIYTIEDGKYIAPTIVFMPNEFEKIIYQVRYDVLRDKVDRIKQEFTENR